MSEPPDPHRRRAVIGAIAAVGLAGLGPLSTATPPQIEGSFFAVGETAESDADLALLDGRIERAAGRAVEIRGSVRDARGVPLAGAIVHVWQATHHGRYAHPAETNSTSLEPTLQGYARLLTDTGGAWRVNTIVPGAYPVERDGTRTAHAHFKVSKAGHHELITQMYFGGESLNGIDRILQALPAIERS